MNICIHVSHILCKIVSTSPGGVRLFMKGLETTTGSLQNITQL